MINILRYFICDGVYIIIILIIINISITYTEYIPISDKIMSPSFTTSTSTVSNVV